MDIVLERAFFKGRSGFRGHDIIGPTRKPKEEHVLQFDSAERVEVDTHKKLSWQFMPW
jgi:hypothetical protein